MMGVVQVRLPEDVSEAIEREVAAGHARSAEEYVVQAVREYMSSEDELVTEARAGIEDMEAGRFVVVDDLDEWGRRNLERVRQRLGDESR
jgi:predicted transcriptional regulator